MPVGVEKTLSSCTVLTDSDGTSVACRLRAGVGGGEQLNGNDELR